MRKIVRLTERDMSRLVRKVIKEQNLINEGACMSENDTDDLKTDMAQLKKSNAVVELHGSCLYISVGQKSYLIV